MRKGVNLQKKQDDLQSCIVKNQDIAHIITGMSLNFNNDEQIKFDKYLVQVNHVRKSNHDIELILSHSYDTHKDRYMHCANGGLRSRDRNITI